MASVSSYRADLARLFDLADADLSELWRLITTADSARDLLMDVLPDLIALYGSAAATLAADWFDDMREQAEAPGRFRAIPATLPDRSRTDALARWGIGPLFRPDPDPDSARTLVSGGLQRIVADASRETVALSSVADPAADGWQRAGSGECTFCSMLIGRGAVYSERSADFASHDHCRCVAAPAFKGAPRPVQPFTPSLRDSSEADRARVREYLRTH